MEITEVFVKVVTSLSPDVGTIYREASPYTMDAWETKQKTLATMAGVGSGLIPVPGLHLPAAVADVGFLINRMGLTAYGIGAIACYDEDFGNLVEEEDLVPILGYWANDDETKNSFKVKGAGAVSKVAIKVGGKAAAKVVSKTVLTSMGYLVASRLGLKSVMKTAPPLVAAASAFAGKAGVKVGTSWVPAAGAAISAGINYWMISSISTAAIEFYNDKLDLVVDI